MLYNSGIYFSDNCNKKNTTKHAKTPLLADLWILQQVHNITTRIHSATTVKHSIPKQQINKMKNTGCENICRCRSISVCWCCHVAFHYNYIDWKHEKCIMVTTLRRIWRYQRANQKPYIEEEQTTQCSKEKGQKDNQRFIKHTYTTLLLFCSIYTLYIF